METRYFDTLKILGLYLFFIWAVLVATPSQATPKNLDIDSLLQLFAAECPKDENQPCINAMNHFKTDDPKSLIPENSGQRPHFKSWDFPKFCSWSQSKLERKTKNWSALDHWQAKMSCGIETEFCSNRDLYLKASEAFPDVKPESLLACAHSEHHFLLREEERKEQDSRDPNILVKEGSSIGYLQIKANYAVNIFEKYLLKNPKYKEAYQQVRGSPVPDFDFSNLEPLALKSMNRIVVEDLVSNGLHFFYGFALLDEFFRAYDHFAKQTPTYKITNGPHMGDDLQSYFQISKRTDILCTLYQLGDPMSRAKKSWDDKHPPRPSYYGLYAQIFEGRAHHLINNACPP